MRLKRSGTINSLRKICYIISSTGLTLAPSWFNFVITLNIGIRMRLIQYEGLIWILESFFLLNSLPIHIKDMSTRWSLLQKRFWQN